MYAGMHPGDAFPFQFSVRTLIGRSMRRKKPICMRTLPILVPALTQVLLDAIGPRRSVVTYNRSSEKGALLALAESAAKPAALRLRDIASRLVDALPIMRAHVYDPAFGGSFSLKDVAPALLGLAYDHLAVGDGAGRPTRSCVCYPLNVRRKKNKHCAAPCCSIAGRIRKRWFA